MRNIIIIIFLNLIFSACMYSYIIEPYICIQELLESSSDPRMNLELADELCSR